MRQNLGAQQDGASIQVAENSGQFQSGVSANPGGRRKEKPWRDALSVAVNRVLEGAPDGRKKLQAIADKVVEQAIAGDMRAAEEIGNRLDGKVPQALIGSDDPDDAPLSVALIELRAVAPKPEGGE